MSSWVAVAVAVMVTLFATNLRAGCPNVCEATTSGVTVSPALDCMNVEAKAQTCNCSVLFEVGNACTAALEPVGFVFGRCSADNQHFDGPCSVVPPNTVALSTLLLNDEGGRSWSFRLAHEGTEHTVVFSSNVSSMGSSGCSMATAPSTQERLVVPGLLAALLALSRLRRRS